MNEPSKSEMLDLIQAALEKLKDSGIDVLFLSSDKNRGVLSGSYEGLATLMAWNMVAYPQMKAVMDIAYKVYGNCYDILKKAVEKDSPSHEIVDNYGLDIEKIVEGLYRIESLISEEGVGNLLCSYAQKPNRLTPHSLYYIIEKKRPRKKGLFLFFF